MSMNASRIGCLALLLSFGISAGAKNYTTTFDADENPLSEGGEWTNIGLDWTAVRSSGGIAFGTQRGTGYDDSYAHLSGFGPNHSVEAIIYKNPAFSFTRNQEVELHLRWADSAHFARGYEVLWDARNGYEVQVVRWNGALGDFTRLLRIPFPRAPVTGDVLKAQIVDGVITVYLNGTEMGSVKDLTWKDGNPGIGFYSEDTSGVQNGHFGFTSFSASDYPYDATVRPNPPTNVTVR